MGQDPVPRAAGQSEGQQLAVPPGAVVTAGIARPGALATEEALGPKQPDSELGMAYTYTPRHKIVLDSYRQREPMVKDYWISPQKLYTADRTSRSHYIRLPRHRSNLDFETVTYPSYFDYKERMLIQYPMLKKTWRVNLGNIILDTFLRSRLGLQDYWSNPQRAYLIGSVSRNSRRHLMVLPGNTAISDVDSTIKPGYCHYKHKLIWKYHWQKLKEDYLSKKVLRI
ncbi:uncharacterized protein [Heterodontus francisci]|uniref:uncharacterized protein n=1 Tax=Heterodontus francisci TaxID=7792 RepID=UPI00355B9B44